MYMPVTVTTKKCFKLALFVLNFQPFIWIVPGCVTGGEKRKSEKARWVSNVDQKNADLTRGQCQPGH